MRTKYLFIAALLAFFCNVNAQKIKSSKFNYNLSWKEVDTLESKGLDSSALVIINKVFNQAKSERNSSQIIKAAIYKINHNTFREENSFNKSIELLEEEIKAADFPLKSLLQSILAEIYWQYYQNNRYRISQRSETVNFNNTDISTWSSGQIIEKTIYNYQLSLQESEKLKSVPIGMFEEILTAGNKLGKVYRPTLFDFLAHRAVDFYTNNEPDLVLPAYLFTINSSDFFLKAPEFINLKVSTRDTFAYKYYALKIFQELIRFHLNDQLPDALIDVDLKRLDFVYQYSNLSNKQDLYLNALQELENKYNSFPASALVSVQIAQVWNQKADLYNPLLTNEHKWDRKKAYEICEDVIKRFPDSRGAALAYNFQQEIKSKSISASVERVNVPRQPFRALVNYKNFKNLFWRIVPVTRPEILAERQKWSQNYDVDQEQKFIQHFTAKASVLNGKVTLPSDNDLNQHSVEIKLDALTAGNYIVIFSHNEEFSTTANGLAYAFTTISNLAYIHRNRDDGSTDFYLVNRTTGEPIPGAKGVIYFSTNNQRDGRPELVKSDSLITDNEGYIKVPFNSKNEHSYYNSFETEFSFENDAISTIDLNNEQVYFGRLFQSRAEDKKWNEQTIFFLDRAIYRPGQPLYYKGLLIKTDGKNPEIIKNRKLTVSFYDVNSQVVTQQQVITNNYGTFSGSFTTPSAGLMGQMSLTTNDYNHSQVFFSVEEYKRPKFEVKFDTLKGSLKLGEKVTVNGKAQSYSGANIDGASVQYRVVRQVIFPFWWWCFKGYYPPSPDMEITNGRSKTGSDGSFKIDFTAVPDENVAKASSPTFIYQVYADVTDINGETHSSSVSVNIGYKALLLGIDVKDLNKSDTSGFKIEIKTTNLEGEYEPASGKITIWKLKTPERAFRERSWQQPDTFLYSKEEFHKYFPDDLFRDENNSFKWEKEKEVFSGPFDTSKGRILKPYNIEDWPAGKYMIQITSLDKFGENVKEVAYFDVSDNISGKPALPSIFEIKEIKVSGEPGEIAKILVGSSQKIKYLFEIEKDGKILEKHWGSLENQQKVFEIPLKEEYRGNVAFHLLAVKNNRMVASSKIITVPYTNKKLDIKFETFRDKLQPGQIEQWKIKIAPKNADKVMAEMVATLYDASLDAFVVHQWDASIYNSMYSRLNWQSLNGFGIVQFRDYQNSWNSFKYRNVVAPEYFQLNWFYNLVKMEKDIEAPAPAFMIEESENSRGASRTKNARAKSLSFSEMDTTVMADMPPNSVQGFKKENEDLSGVIIRKNFKETAFFYPHLQTNELGEIIINFTIPEALTRWKMLGFAHTANLKSGLIQKELITQKDLMVVPNQPRFFRENDKMIFQAKINNMVHNNLEGQARLEFFDALTMEPVDLQLRNGDNVKNFSLKAQQSTNVEWTIEIPEGIQALTYRIVARSGDFSDGEEMTLPVVTNKTLVTETLPLAIRGKQTKEFKLEKLLNDSSSTLKNNRFTLEFTSNPAWYAVQALPYLIENPYDCTEQLFSRFYANSISSLITTSNPAIKRVFDTWSNIQPDALLSNMEKNPELKTALLQETPWVLNAKSESERKRNIAMLFDPNKMSDEQGKAISKILQVQLGNGSFSWFSGLPEDLYITQYIVAGFGHLDIMGVKYTANKEKITNMLSRAIEYIDDKMQNRYDNIKAEAKKGNVKIEDNNLDYYLIQYLYSRSYYKSININDSHKEAFNYWINQAKKYWPKLDIYTQGMVALALKRYGETQIPAEIIRSLKERSLHSDEMGMYWKLSRGFYWYEAPVEIQSLMIEVFDEVANDSKAVNDLKVWLLKQKQTQDWRTTKATSEACYALLRKGTDILSNNQLAEVTIGKEKINPAKREDVKIEAGTGYFKTAWSAADIKPEMGNIKIKKTDDGVAWGAVYWQYFEQLDKITSAETPLKLSKKLFKQVNTERGPVITPVSDTSVLHTGDVVKVRIELRADRTMEYIHLKDMRASAFEPVETLSGYKYQDGLWYYQSPGDLATNFFIGYLPKGTYVFEYSLRVSQVGNFSNGITTVQCMYAPEFSSHSEGVRIKVEK